MNGSPAASRGRIFASVSFAADGVKQTAPGCGESQLWHRFTRGDVSGRIAGFLGERFTILNMLRFVTAGESHGQALIAWISGLPAGLAVDLEFVARELHRRQLGYGRGGRQRIEKDSGDILAGVRHGKTIGAPIAVRIENRDWKNWEKALPVEDSRGG